MKRTIRNLRICLIASSLLYLSTLGIGFFYYNAPRGFGAAMVLILLLLGIINVLVLRSGMGSSGKKSPPPSTPTASNASIEMLNAICTMAHMCYWELDFPRDAMVWSDHFEKDYGWTNAEIPHLGLGRSKGEGGDPSYPCFVDLIHPDDRPLAAAALAEYQSNPSKGRYFHADIRIRHKNGSYVWISSAGGVSEWDEQGNPIRLIGGIYDTSALHEALTASNAKSNFLANMSHEIRTPMNVVMGISEILLREDLQPRIRENIEIIKQAGSSLLSLINDILDLSKIEAGRMEIVEAKYYLESLLHDVVNIIRQRAMEKHLFLGLYVYPFLPQAFFGDETRIRQILVNLLNNAVKYTKEGSVLLEVTSQTNERGEMLLCFSVIDTGIGIKQKDMDKLFTNYTQFDLKKNRGVEGSGLGLPITKRLCEMMNGTITVESEYGQGSTFTARIPQEVADSSLMARLEGARPAPGPAGSGMINRKGTPMRVLCFNANPTVHSKSIRRMLEDFGVAYKYVLNIDDFRRELSEGSWPFVFIWYEQYALAREALKEYPAERSITVFTRLGESDVYEYNDNIRIIPIPVYGNTLAAILDDREEKNDGRHEGKGRRFTAPEARVLVVDDMKSNILVVRGLLAPYKMETDSCSSGEESIDMVQQKDYDMVFMDHMMPGMDGIEAVGKIRALGGKYKELPIIALTANAMTGMREMFLEAGFNDYLSKPIEINKLNNMLYSWLPAEKQQLTVFTAEKQKTNQPPPDGP